jgi:enoyl-CoA hydratase/carnithine racemase
VLGQLAAAAHRLPQLCGQLARWLAGQDTAGRLAHATGGLDDALDDVQASLDRAARHATRLGKALDQAHQATAWLYRPGDGGEDR